MRPRRWPAAPGDCGSAKPDVGDGHGLGRWRGLGPREPRVTLGRLGSTRGGRCPPHRQIRTGATNATVQSIRAIGRGSRAQRATNGVVVGDGTAHALVLQRSKFSLREGAACGAKCRKDHEDGAHHSFYPSCQRGTVAAWRLRPAGARRRGITTRGGAHGKGRAPNPVIARRHRAEIAVWPQQVCSANVTSIAPASIDQGDPHIADCGCRFGDGSSRINAEVLRNLTGTPCRSK
jgi:hypothetical protein